MIRFKIPQVTFNTRVKKSLKDGSQSFQWQDVSTKDLFSGKKIFIFALPGAFTPTCSDHQLPGFEKIYSELLSHGIEDVYCLAVNDAFVMNAWGKSLDIKNVKLLPDGSGEFTRKMGMLVRKDNVGFGFRSWRYGAIVEDMVVTDWFVEEGLSDNCATDPYEISSPENVLKFIKENKK
ncbi:peroxiredoxin [Candidatus Liberibacter brunswickensis]|uniref:peroxiredoxin n=1 Tax=Candidatus Liberibacter brunswickensis TaxID=1968796 RepID=UPI002FE16584